MTPWHSSATAKRHRKGIVQLPKEEKWPKRKEIDVDGR
jgi:hypothetical protein